MEHPVVFYSKKLNEHQKKKRLLLLFWQHVHSLSI